MNNMVNKRVENKPPMPGIPGESNEICNMPDMIIDLHWYNSK